ncbi:MAG: 5-methyltetrahydropteroyltriglutamate--homocysteine S-methyltransferase [Gomphosphaeria aponina SAG 52.96 = DSM 107014]|uniref:5-methyltetrahydropteroyltriglutamate--homocysteine S-methyltransferase n=1 Tax=Gomphosphaeria aponina SAG 52.96 = DSM 107014 TaxID=1521640 RepID=A0A941JQ25_9CHRO|nr:5-methyltetrahydropteroyltriglutamate--homocysteine S-methyltransferase [Gomphosphaeria aponina SAG 52.96 = DSM 107014]
MSIITSTVGYPRIGKNREVKKALESFWRDELTADKLLQIVREVEETSWKIQAETGIEQIGIGDATLYDQVLDWSVRFGLIPARFQPFTGLERYEAMARGKDGVPALEMTKWFDTNYHYLVPEITSDISPKADWGDFREMVKRGLTILGKKAVPIILGPLTLLRLSRLEGVNLGDFLSKLLPLYSSLLTELKELGIEEVQLHEPALVFGDAPSLKEHFQAAYAEFAQADVAINLVTYFDDLGETFPWVIELPVAAISLDFTRGRNLDLIKTYGWQGKKRLGIGIVDARNIWLLRPQQIIPIVSEIQALVSDISLQPSASLQFVPYDSRREKHLPEQLRNVLSFAEQKLQEVNFLAQIIAGNNREEALTEDLITAHWEAFQKFSTTNDLVEEKLKNLTVKDFQRSLSYSLRLSEQVALPPLPTTTIGSFPQTQEVRKLRLKYKQGELNQTEYQKAIDAEIAKCIQLQEEIGLDVLVHGEFERTDMVEYFGQQLVGFAFTEHGWVQSYGSRYVRPPIIYRDVVRNAPMTVREFQFAQSLTKKPVKAMLTGPVTIINWSFTRTDIPRRDQAFQIAIALREEIADLETAGAQVIQVDEPALREGLPLKVERWSDYLSWAVDAFRLTTAIAQSQTQIHTHMCYSEFGDIIKDIERLDADVLSIENSRSNNRTLQEIAQGGYSHQVGNGVYDIHSPVVPTVEQLISQLQEGTATLPLKQIWVNPDCGLKTRRWEEVIPALKNMVEATKKLRDELNLS